MAKEINLADIEPQIELIKQINIGTVQKVIARAEREAMAAGKRQQRVVKRVLHPGKLARTLDKAMSFHGRSARGQPSIRLKAPDTGGRPFHFGFTVVTKGVRAKKNSGKTGAAGGAPAAQGQAAAAAQPGPQPASGAKQSAGKKGRNRRQRASTGEGAHQLYTERDAAIDIAQPLDRAFINSLGPDFQIGSGIGLDPTARTNTTATEEELENPGLPKTPKSKNAERPTAQEWVEEGMSLTPGLSPRSSESAAQRYIEDPSKLPKLRGHTASFGTIGDTVEERLRFWELVHEHESDKGAHTQSRLVLELPHEATAAERHEIVRTFTDKAFRAKGLPYWVSIHAPTKENDWRNHHAHVVFSERPAEKMINPETGQEEWDFTIPEQYKRANRANAIRYPHRQNRDQDFRDRGWVKRARAEFSATVNEVMERAGKGRLYDPRSYKDMGLDASPMKNVSRIIADKTKTKTFVVMDAEWTRKMIDEEIRDAAIRRDATFQALVKTEAMIVEAAKSATHTAKIQAKLPKHLRMGPTMLFGTQLTNTITTKVLETERERLAQQFVNEATERALQHVIQATSPRPKARTKGKVYDTENAPDPEDLVDLHTAATKELAAHRLATATTRQKISARMRELRKQWNRHDNQPPESPPTAPQPAKTRADQPGPETFATEQAPTRSTSTTASPQQTQAPSRSASISPAQLAPGETQSRSQTEQAPAAFAAGAPVARREARQPAATPAAGRPRGYRGLPPLSEAAARLSAAMGAAIDMVGDIAPENVKSAMQQALDAMGAKEAALRAALRQMEKEQGPLIPRPQQRPQIAPQPTQAAPAAATVQPPAPAPAPPPPAAEQPRAAQSTSQDTPLARPTTPPPAQTGQSQPGAVPGLPTIPPRDPRPLEMRIITHPAPPPAPATRTEPPAPTPTQAADRPPAPQPPQPATEQRPATQPRAKQETRPAPKPKAPESSGQPSRQPSLFDGPGMTPPQPRPPEEKPRQPEEPKQTTVAAQPPETPELTAEQLAEKRRKERRRVFVRGREKGRGGFER